MKFSQLDDEDEKIHEKETAEEDDFFLPVSSKRNKKKQRNIMEDSATDFEGWKVVDHWFHLFLYNLKILKKVLIFALIQDWLIDFFLQEAESGEHEDDDFAEAKPETKDGKS